MSNYKGKVNSSINQKIKRKFIEREIHCCASFLISELAQLEGYGEDLLPIMTQDDYEIPTKDYLDDITREDCINYIGSGTDFKHIGSFSEGTLKGLSKLIKRHLKNGNFDYKDFCNFFDLEPCQNEALEHWRVSDFLAEKLEAKGEMVIYDFLGFTIWGRCTSGQAILLDGVISEICADMEILDGQKYSWAPKEPEPNTEPDVKRLRQVRDALNKTKSRDKIEQIASILDI